MEINNDILNLIIRNLQGKTAANEQAKLDQWLQSSEDNQLEYQKIADIWKGSQNINVGIDVDKEWNTFKSKHFDSQKGGKLITVDFKMVSRIAAAAILVIGMFLLGQHFLGSQTFTTYSGERLLVNLEDGTKVILGENSQLEVPSSFNRSTRTLSLNGEAFFTVAKNPDKPFEIAGEQTTTRVLGTEFYLLASKINNEIRVSGGKVSYWQNRGNDTLILTRGEEGSVVQNTLSERNITSVNYDSWQTGLFLFESQSLAEVLESLQDYYIFNVEDLKALGSLHCEFTGKFEDQSIEDVLEELALVMGLKYEWNQNTLSIKAQNCK